MMVTTRMKGNSKMNTFKIALGVFAAIIGIVLLTMVGRITESVDADEILVVQDPIDGDLHWYTSPGIKPQWFGKATTYLKRDIYEIIDARIRFNDAGHATINGSVQYDMPLDIDNLTKLHTRYGSAEAIKDQVIKRTVDKVIYMTGPLMSSRESYAEKRTDLINFVQDQIDRGVYKVVQRVVRQADIITGTDKTSIVAEVARDGGGDPMRQEASIVGEFGIRAFNFAISQLAYDETVEKQIQQQQTIAMDVQTAIAEARKAEQRKLTVEQEGAANAAKAKWDQEVIKATEVTAAEQRLAVQTLAVKTAEAYRQEQMLRAEADAGYRRKVLEADGALAAKLSTLEKINDRWAQAFEKYPGQLVPSVVMGNGGSGTGLGAAQSFMELLTAKTALDLGVAVKPGRSSQ